MARIQRGLPRRPARLYPVGTRLTMRDGRVFEVRQKVITVYEHHWAGGPGQWVKDRTRYWALVSGNGNGPS